jgi:hypothetical protein
MKFLNLLIITIFVAGFTSCKSHKLKKNEVVITANPGIPEEIKPSQIDTIKAIEAIPKVHFETLETNFESIKIKSKISIKSEKLNQSIPANIHIKKDSTIWISVAIGLEAARASITKDSLFLLDRLNRKAYMASFKELSKQFNFEITYQMLQSFLVGNLPISINNQDLFTKNPNFNQVFQKRNTVEVLNKFDLELNRIFEIEANDTNSDVNLKIAYKSYTKADEKLIPKLILVLLNTDNNPSSPNVSIEIEHSKFDFLDRDVRFPFNIPKGYSIEPLPKF